VELDEGAAAAAKRVVAQRFEREPAKGGRVQALYELHAKLVECAADGQSDSVEMQRDSVVRAALSISNYLQDQGFKSATVSPITRIVTAIIEAERGRPDPIFEPTKNTEGGRARLSDARRTRDGTLAALAKLYADARKPHGCNQEVAFEECARRMSGPWFGTVSAAQLRKALETARGESRDHQTRIQYEHVTSIISDLLGCNTTMSMSHAFTRMVIFCNETMNPAMGEAAFPKTPHVSGDE
jgi:hypothetical protein